LRPEETRRNKDKKYMITEFRLDNTCMIDRLLLFSGVTIASSGGLMSAPPTIDLLLGYRDELVSTVVALRINIDFFLDGGAKPSRDEWL
jgi:hypothetical protein